MQSYLFLDVDDGECDPALGGRGGDLVAFFGHLSEH